MSNTVKKCQLQVGGTTVGVKLKTVARRLNETKAKTSYCSPCCNERVGRKNYCKECGQELSRSDIDRRFFKISKDDRVILKKEELDAIKKQTNKNFIVDRFVKTSEVPLAYTKKSYYLVPSEDSEKPKLSYLAKAMVLTSTCAVGRYVLRKNEKLAIIRPFQGGLLVQNLFWSQALRDKPEGYKLLGAEFEDDKLAKLKKLVQVKQGDFVWSDFESEYYENFKELVMEAKDRSEEELETVEVKEIEEQSVEGFFDSIDETVETEEELAEAEA